MKIDPRHLVQIATVVDSRTLAEAAAALGTTQPALSRLIADLETRLGTPLFERRKRPFVPTDCARELAAKGRVIAIAAEQAAQVTERLLSGRAGDVRIGAPPFLCDRAMAEALSSFQSERPDVRITLRTAYLPELRAELRNGDLDLAFGPAFLLEDSSDLRFESVFTDRNVVVARHGHPLAASPCATAEALSAATWVGHGERSLLNDELQTLLTSLGVGPARWAIISDSSDGLVSILMSSDSLAMLPARPAGDHIKAGRLALVKTALSAPVRPLGLAYRSTRLLSAAAKALRAHISNRLGRCPAASADV